MLTYKTKSLVYTAESGHTKLNYRLFEPKKLQHQKLPLVLILHGAGARGDDNKSQLGELAWQFINNKIQKMHPSLVVIPQCPIGVEWVNRSNNNIPYTHYKQDQTIESTEMKLIYELIMKLKSDYPINVYRIYVTGFSMGATGTWDILTRYPKVFAGAVIFSGVSDTTKAHLVAQIPIKAFSGENDSIAPSKLNSNMCDAINHYGGNCTFTNIKDVGHDCVSQAFRKVDIIQWLFSIERDPL